MTTEQVPDMSLNFLFKAAVRKVLRQENLRKPDGTEDLLAKCDWSVTGWAWGGGLTEGVASC